MKAYGGDEVQNHSILTSSVEEGVSGFRPPSFYPRWQLNRKPQILSKRFGEEIAILALEIIQTRFLTRPESPKRLRYPGFYCKLEYPTYLFEKSQSLVWNIIHKYSQRVTYT
jgi:hypothetical protein